MRVVILGAGYAGLGVARRLEKRLSRDVELVVVDERPYHLVQHELHRVIRRPGLAEDIRVPLEDALDRAEIRVGRVEAVDRDGRTVRFEDGDELEYDYAAVCLGATTEFFELPGVEDRSTPLKRLEHAHRIRADFLELESDASVVIVGAGLSGVQVAGELAALAREADREVRIELLEQFDSVAPHFPENFRRAIRDELTARGIAVNVNRRAARAEEGILVLDSGDEIDYDQLVWTGGIRGSTAVARDRPTVAADLRLDERTFAVGDAVRMIDSDGEAVPASAQAAIRGAKTVAANVAALVEHEREGSPNDFPPRLSRFRFDSPGWIVSVGDGAVAQVGPTVVTGGAAVALKATVGAGYLSSVGAIRNAVELVDEEIGLDAGRS